MKYRSIFIILLISTFSGTTTSGQEMFGTVLGNYAGLDNLQLNPSGMNNSKVFLDVRLLGADIFLENNYMYLSKREYKFGNFFKSGYQLPTHMEEYGTEERIFYPYGTTNMKSFYASQRINGPGAMLIWKKHAFAVTTGIRNVLSGRHIPYEIMNFAYLGLNYKPQQNINYHDTRPFNVAQMTWAEIGVGYSYEVYARGINKITAGITVKRLLGYSGFWLGVKNADYIVPDDSTIIVNNLDARYGISLPLNYANNAFISSPLIKGGGFGFDIGATFYRLKKIHQEQIYERFCEPPYEDYLYRIGISLVDVGAIRFKKNANLYAIENQASYWDDVNHIKFRNIEQMLDTISYKFYGDNSSAYVDNNFLVWLPSALSVQFDYHYYRNWYINGTAIYGFQTGQNSLSRPSELSITPRYESEWFEASLPVSLYDWYLPRIGLSLRFYYLTIGTDKLGYFFRMSNFTGFDFYFNLKFFLSKGNCRSKGPNGCQEKSYQTKEKLR